MWHLGSTQMQQLTGVQRTSQGNRWLGYLLAFNAGALNAGGFMVLQVYTSHMTGFVSTLADQLVLGNTALVLGAMGALLAFGAGAACAAIMVHWARHRQLHSTYALPLLLQAGLMLLFGLVGAVTMDWHTWFAVPLTVLLLSFMMGVQNATLTKMSQASVRTTHMTGVVTDLGMELGKLLYWNRSGPDAPQYVRANTARMALLSGLLGLFLLGGVVGAWSFQHWGFVCVLPLAVAVMAVSLPPLYCDVQRLRQQRAKRFPFSD